MKTTDWSSEGQMAAAPLSYAAITAGLELLPEGLYLAQFHLVKGDWHLSNGVVPAEAVVVQHLEVQSPLPHFLIREAWERGGKKKEL